MNSLAHIKTKLLAIIGLCLLSQSSFAAPTSYYLGPEDVLEISVWKEETLKREVLIRPDGKFSFPLIGEISAMGRTPEQIQLEVIQKLEKFIPDPVVTVLLTKVAAYKVYVIGQVKKPGQFVMGRFLNVVQALALAGGLTPFAAQDDIKIIRSVGNKQTAIPFRFSKIKTGRDLKQNILLIAGDVIVVP